MAIAATIEETGKKNGQEQAAQPRYFGYASFWSRVGAFVIDSFVILLAAAVFIIAILALFGFDSVQEYIPNSPEEYLAALLPVLIYFAFLESAASRATPGKIASGIKVTDMENHQISVLKGIIRNFWKLTLSPGVALSFFGETKQALHDKIANSLVVRRGESYFWLAFFMMLVPVAIVVAGVSYYVFSEVNARMIAKGPDEKVEQGIVSKVNERSWQMVTTEQYEQALSVLQPTPQADTMAGLAGPFLVRLDQFFEDKRDPKIWIKVTSGDIPNLQTSGFTEVTIDHIISVEKKNIYNANSGFEEGLFRQLSFQKDGSGLSAVRTVHLTSGAVNGDVLGVSGNINLRLPHGIEVAEFVVDKISIGAEKKTASEVEMRFVEANESRIKIRYKGKQEMLLGAVGINNAGQQLEIVKSTVSDLGDFYNVEYEFASLPAKIQIAVASGFTERNYPFTLGKEFKKVVKSKEE